MSRIFNEYQELVEYVRKKEIRTLDLKIPELSGRWRHLTVPVNDLSPELFQEGLGFDGSNYGYASLEASDMVFVPELKTGFFDPFWEVPTLSFLGNIYRISETGDTPYSGDPRRILKNALSRMRKLGAADKFIIGPEFEYYIFDLVNHWNTSRSAGYNINSQEKGWHNQEQTDNPDYQIENKDGYHKDLPHDHYRDLRVATAQALSEAGIEVKYHHHKVGSAGQQEIEVKRRAAEKMGDAALIAKYFIKNMALKRGKMATFMPKPMYGEAGSGFHVHMQLSKNKNPIFSGNKYAGLSQTALYFMGGILTHTPALMAFAASTTNSYKRLVRGFEAPVAICFATANRSSVIRVPGYAEKAQDRRFEFRPGDACGNPYLYFASLLMAGLDGIKEKIDPLENNFGPVEENVEELSRQEIEKLQFLPQTLTESLSALEKDHKFLVKDNVFPENITKSWIERKKEEINKLEKYPTAAEYRKYFDL
ncbi:MAG: type I glutamate--ammonia ligase [Halanaerobiales bacterium]